MPEEVGSKQGLSLSKTKLDEVLSSSISPISPRPGNEFDLDKAKLTELQISPLLEDRIVAILMNDDIGSCGYWEEYARVKAKAIVELINASDPGSE